MGTINLACLTGSFLFVALLLACNGDYGAAGADAGAGEADQTAGFTAVCASCHQLPDPADLTTGLWDTVVLPRMGHFLGRFTPGERRRLLFNDPGASATLLANNIYPEKPLVTDADWATIRQYYLANSPATLPPLAYPDVAVTDQFQARFPQVFLSPPSTNMLRIPPEGGIVMADINKESLFAFNPQLEPTGQIPTGAGLTDLAGNAGTVIGSFSPTDRATGQLIALSPAGTQVLADSLQRPTSLLRLNLDDDPADEFIITEYGKWTGRLSRWDLQPDGSYAGSTLAERSGAIQVLQDTSATVPTVYVLYGQGREEIVRYRFGKAGLETEVVLSFPPSYGSSSLQLIDWNHDAYPDLLYTNGDNADYVSAPKPYHGVRVFTGNAAGTFTEALFLALPGAYGAVAHDFDADGDTDLAAVAFFPDFSREEPAAAVYFRNDGASGFTARRLPAANKGRFLRLTAGDFDGDGDVDLAAGSLAMQAIPDQGRMAGWLQNGLPFVVWENRRLGK